MSRTASKLKKAQGKLARQVNGHDLFRIQLLGPVSRSRLCDRVLHGNEGFGVTNSDIDRLQSTDTHGAFGEVGIGIDQDLELAEHADQ